MTLFDKCGMSKTRQFEDQRNSIECRPSSNDDAKDLVVLRDEELTSPSGQGRRCSWTQRERDEGRGYFITLTQYECTINEGEGRVIILHAPTDQFNK